MHRLGIINVKKFCSIPILWLWCYAIICCDEVNFRIFFYKRPPHLSKVLFGPRDNQSVPPKPLTLKTCVILRVMRGQLSWQQYSFGSYDSYFLIGCKSSIVQHHRNDFFFGVQWFQCRGIFFFVLVSNEGRRENLWLPHFFLASANYWRWHFFFSSWGYVAIPNIIV